MSELYHYTTAAGLLGMLKNYKTENPDLTMRATHCNYLNDRSEFFWGIKLCCNAIYEYEKQNSIPEEERLSKYIKDPYDESTTELFWFYSSYINNIDYGFPYLISFSRAKDSLPMWGMYAKQGNGIALVFDEDRLQYTFSDSICKDCIYCQDDEMAPVMDMIQEDYNKYLHEIRHEKSSISTWSTALADIRLHNMFRKIGPYVKHKSFEYEEEFRIVVSNPLTVSYKMGDDLPAFESYSNTTSDKLSDNILFREKEGMIIPYVEQKISIDYLKGIIIGPTTDFDRQKEALRIFMRSKHIDTSHIEITKSKVPYRE